MYSRYFPTTPFKLVLEVIIRKVKMDNPNNITGQLQIIVYADDLVIITTTKTAIIKPIDKQDKETKKDGSRVKLKQNKIHEDTNQKKTHTRVNNTRDLKLSTPSNI